MDNEWSAQGVKRPTHFSYLFHVRVAYDDALIRGLIIVFTKEYTIAAAFKKDVVAVNNRTPFTTYLLNEQIQFVIKLSVFEQCLNF